MKFGDHKLGSNEYNVSWTSDQIPSDWVLSVTLPAGDNDTLPNLNQEVFISNNNGRD